MIKANAALVTVRAAKFQLVEVISMKVELLEFYGSFCGKIFTSVHISHMYIYIYIHRYIILLLIHQQKPSDVDVSYPATKMLIYHSYVIKYQVISAYIITWLHIASHHLSSLSHILMSKPFPFHGQSF